MSRIVLHQIWSHLRWWRQHTLTQGLINLFVRNILFLSLPGLSLIVLRYMLLIREIILVIGLGLKEVLAGVIMLPRVTGHPVLRVTVVRVEVVLLVLRPEIGTELVLIARLLAGVNSLDLILAVVPVWPPVDKNVSKYKTP
ncbi:hypothetical protein PoB_001384000 [Plakobranchus ocellatus]|uniref:Uncharacterized protein n=1 Tax=Plakobranchus ocellatus TaxID=259542 RepID=A0AAV3YVT3_9GAST|nr:hypothetical protein PoB_001384000 [Plakobranchus ocellatus]